MQRGGENKGLESQADGQVVDPARGTAGFHDDQVDIVVFEVQRKIFPVGRCIEELVFPSFRIEKAAAVGLSRLPVTSGSLKLMRFTSISDTTRQVFDWPRK